MIPRRVKLCGFLCYKDEQEIAFDGSSLWMLAGLNGSGKSSVFDAVTYALFGHHRGGSQNASELINKDSKSLSVEFDFLVDGHPFRITRTLRKDARGATKGTQNIFRLDSGSGKWTAVPDTNLSDGFKAWVRDKIGLNYETFTSSVLLLQGRAEKLLDSGPKDRAAVLAGVVDLERYQNLHEKADAERKAIKARLEVTEGQLTGVPEVTDIELVAAENKIDAAEQAKNDAAKEVDRLLNLEFEARRWVELQARLTGFDVRWKKAEAITRESTAIENDYRRMRELTDVIPHLLIIQEKQRAVAESERSSQQLTVLKEQSGIERSRLDNAGDLARKKKTSLQATLMQEEQRLEEVRGRLRELAGPIAQLGMFEEHSNRLKQLDEQLKRLPSSLAESVGKAQDDFDRKVELGKVAPLLDRFATVRLQIGTSTKKGNELAQSEKETRDAGEKAKQDQAELKAKFDVAVKERQQADQAVSEARLLFQQARAAVAEFEKLEGSRVCRACGQPLTPAHWQLEQTKRDSELDNITAIHAKAAFEQKAKLKSESAIREESDAAERELTRLRDAYRDCNAELRQVREQLERLHEECRLAYQQLPQSYRGRIAPSPAADWLTTTWPTADDRKSIAQEASELTSARERLRELQAQLRNHESLFAQRTATQDLFDRVKAAFGKMDPATFRKDESRLKAEDSALATKLQGTKSLIQETEREIEQVNKQLGDLQATLANIESRLNVESATCIQFREAIERASKLLPPIWRESAAKAGLAEQNKWKAELEALTTKGTETRYQELAQTRASLESLKQDIALAKEDERQFPTEARRPVNEVKAMLSEARIAVDNCAKSLQAAGEEKAILDRHRADRDRLHQQKLALDKELAQATMLAQLLGRDRLQRYLVRTAERQIVDYANGILDRLSGGQLFLRLCSSEEGSGADRALDLEAYNRMTGESAINVNFLSGSQRFRVAVSLALGIGQYASRQHRPIESVIIDEGFGCLDRNGRQVMIQELQNLRGQLKCVLLVSHQEEFADAFPDGYRFELVNGSTHIKRFQR